MSFRVKRIKSVDEVLANWPFFLQGLPKLNDLVREERKKVKPEVFFQVITDAVARGDQTGHVAIYQNEEMEQIGYSVTLTDFCKYHEPSAIVYAAYTTTTIHGLTKFMLGHVEKWARSQGLKELKANSPRFSGKGMYLFEKRWGFRRWLVMFSKPL